MVRATLCLLVCLVVSFLPPLFADIEGMVEGVIRDRQGAPVADVDIQVEADNRWGARGDSDWQAFAKRYKNLPAVSGKASTKSGADGSFKFSIKVTVAAEGTLPENRRKVDGKTVSDPYVVVKGTLLKRPEFRVDFYAWRLVNGFKMPAGDVVMVRPSTYRAALVHKADGSPAANVAVEVMGLIWNYPEPERYVVQEVKTDAAGVLSLDEAKCPRNVLKLRVREKSLAIDKNSHARRDKHLQEGAIDDQKIELVAGGSLAFNVVDGATGKSQGGTFEVLIPGDTVIDRGVLAEGTTRVMGLPVGAYALILSGQPGIRFLSGLVEVKAGEEATLTPLAVWPLQKVTVQAKAESGAQPERFDVTLTQVAGLRLENQPTGAGGRPQIHGYGQGGSVELTGVPAGRWSVEVTAPGFSPVTVEIEVPAAAPLVVRLSRGGILQFSAGTERMWGLDSLLMVSAGAPSRPILENMACEDVLTGDRRRFETAGIFPTPGGDGGRVRSENGRIEQVPPAKYIVFAMYAQQFYRFDDVEVRADVVTSLELKPAPSTVKLTLSEGAKPLASASLVALFIERRDGFGGKAEKQKPRTLRTDAAGLATLAGLPAGEWQIVSQRVYDWLRFEGGPPEAIWDDRLQHVNKRHRVRVGNGDKCELKMDASDPARIFLVVKAAIPKGVKMSTVVIESMEYPDSIHAITERRSAALQNGEFVFGLVRPGTYKLTPEKAVQDDTDLLLYRRIEVRQPREQTVNLSFSVHKLTVNVKLPAGAVKGALHTGIEPADADPFVNGVGAGKAADPSGKAEYQNIAGGRYHVWAYLDPEKRDGVGAVSLSGYIDLAKDSSITLSADANAGDIQLRLFLGKPRQNSRDFNGWTMGGWWLSAELTGKDGKPVEVEGSKRIPIPNWPSSTDSERVLANVPAGTYTLRISGLGFETLTKENVVVTKGGVVSVQAEMKPVAHVIISAKNILDDALANSKVSYEALDITGKVLPVAAGKTVFVPPVRERGASQIELVHIPLECVKVRLKVEGYKAVDIDVTSARDLRVYREVELAAG